MVIAGRPRKEVFFASIVMRKTYVGFYYMPVYTDVDLKAFFAPELLKLLKGKSCFYVKVMTPELTGHIERALESGLPAIPGERLGVGARGTGSRGDAEGRGDGGTRYGPRRGAETQRVRRTGGDEGTGSHGDTETQRRRGRGPRRRGGDGSERPHSGAEGQRSGQDARDGSCGVGV